MKEARNPTIAQRVSAVDIDRGQGEASWEEDEGRGRLEKEFALDVTPEVTLSCWDASREQGKPPVPHPDGTVHPHRTNFFDACESCDEWRRKTRLHNEALAAAESSYSGAANLMRMAQGAAVFWSDGGRLYDIGDDEPLRAITFPQGGFVTQSPEALRLAHEADPKRLFKAALGPRFARFYQDGGCDIEELAAELHAQIVGGASVTDVLASEVQADALEVRAWDILFERKARARADEIEAESGPVMVVNTRADLEELRAPEPLWDGWLYSSSPALLSAPGGVGKSALCLGLVVAMHHGLPFLGGATRQGKVLYIAGEGERAIVRRLRAWEQHLGVPEGSTEIYAIYGHTLTAGNLTKLGEIVRAGRYDVVIADTFSALTRVESENNNSEVSRFLRSYHRAVLDANPEACPVLVHHVTQQTDTQGRTRQKARGASAFRDDVDTVILLEGSSDNFRMSTEMMKGGKQKDARPRTLEGLALSEVGASVVVIQQNEVERAGHRAEVQRLVGLLVPGNGYTSTELQGVWGMASNKGRYQALRTQALDQGLIVKGEGNKGRYVRAQ